MTSMEFASLGDLSKPKQWPVLSKLQMQASGYPVYGANGRIGFADRITHPAPVLLVGCRGSCGAVHVTEGPAYANGNAMALDQLATNRVDLHYLARFLRFRGFSDVTTGTSQPQITRENIVRVLVPLPKLEKQRQIATILDRADTLRDRRRAALGQCSALSQSVFAAMFGDPDANPMSWPTMSLGTMLKAAEVFTDGDWVESKDQDPTGEVRLIQLADIGDAVYLNKSSRFLTRGTAVRLRCTFLKPGDVLVARMPDPLGRACLFPGEARESVTVVDVCVIRPAPSGPDPAWLMSCINMPGFRRLMAREATGTTRQRISRGNLSRLRITAPPLELQRSFSATVAKLSAEKDRMLASLAKLDELFTSLQHQAFRGEL